MSRLTTIILGAFLFSLQGSVLCEDAAKGDGNAEELPAALEPPPSPEEYRVSSKDVIEVAIVGEKDLPIYFEVGKDGAINYPYIEYVPVANKTVKQIERDITGLLKDGWFVNPQVSVRVFQYCDKFVYVQGKVNRAGKHSFTGRNKMTVYRAIIMAGGFAPNANEKKVTLSTTDDTGKEVIITVNVSDIMKKNPELDPAIKADDIINVPESFF